MKNSESDEPVLGPISAAQRRRMVAAVDARIRHYQRCKKLLSRIDEDVFQAGLMMLESEGAIATWLCQPALSQDGKIPLDVMRTAKGRKQVASAMRRIAYEICA